jgi:hypothetical protein
VAVSLPSASTELPRRVGVCKHCHRACWQVQVVDHHGNVVSETVGHNADVWTDRVCSAEYVEVSPVTLDAARLSEIGDLIRYETSVTFTSARAYESVRAMHTALKAVRALHHVISVPSSPDDFMEICAGCGEEGDGPCSTLRALGEAKP